MNPTFAFEADLFLWPKGNWVFLAVPEDESDVIADIAPTGTGWGSVPVKVSIGETEWETSVFPDSKRGCYVLPVKKAVRRIESVDTGDTVAVTLTLRLG